MLEVKYKNYSELPINKYLEIKEIMISDDDKFEKEMRIISILCDVSMDDLYEMELSSLQGINSNLAYLSESIKCSDIKDSITINGKDYNVCTKVKEFTVAQYVDFQNYPKDENHMAENLSTFVVPNGKKYGEGYDIVEVINEFKEHLSIEDAVNLQNFFIKKLVNSIKDILHSLLPLMKREMKKTKNPKAQEILKTLKELDQKYGSQ